ncbi:hypothetical protein BH10BDE1_BH10BDE1_17310 [soil metagenome]
MESAFKALNIAGRMLVTLKDFSKLAVAVLLPAFLMGCRAGGGITATPSQAPYVAVVDIPTIALPSSSPFYSKNDTLTITGQCQTGFLVTLSGDSTDTQTCANSTYSFSVLKLMDGLYSFQITQTGEQKTTSVPAPLVWVKKTSVSAPQLTSPNASPYLSGLNSITLAGGCESGATLTLQGDGAGSTTCINSAFSFSVPKLGDGDYNISVQQTDRAGNSATSAVVWKRYGITVSPSNPSIVVGTSQALTIAGGSGSYAVNIVTNNSGGSYNSSTKVYTPGTISGVTDSLMVVDSLGTTKPLTVSTVSASADHLMLAAVSGDSQVKAVGALLDDPMSVKVVDRYGNGIPSYQLYFQVVSGDGRIIGNPVKTTNASGTASVSMRLGFQSTTNSIFVSPLSGTLPDLAASGKATLSMVQTAAAAGKGALGATFAVSTNPAQFVLIDTNLDGFKDVVELNTGDHTIGILLSQGNGLFGAMTKITGVCLTPSGIAAGDFNGDGKPDIVVTCANNDTILVYTGKGDGTFNAANATSVAPDATRPTAIIAVDLDADGKIDLAMASGAGVVAVMKGRGDATFVAPVAFNVGLAPAALVAVDLNKDGKLDLAVTDTDDNTIRILNGDGSLGFAAPVVYGAGVGPVAMAVGDFNKDTWPDLVVTHNGEDTVGIYNNDGTGLLVAANSTAVGGGPSSLSVGDFSGDGNLDVAVLNSGDSSISMMLGNSAGFLALSETFPTLTSPAYILAADVNGDTTPDLLVTGNGFLHFVPTQTGGTLGFATAVGSNPNAAAVGLLDGDTYLDAAILNNSAKTVSILVGNNRGFYALKATLPTGNNPSSIVLRDLNRDGFLDVIVANQDSATVRVFLGVGNGTFGAGVDYTTGSGPAEIAAQDYNHDGFTDLAIACVNTSKVSILLGNGDGTFQTKVDIPSGSVPGTGPVAIVAVDLDGDKAMDLVVANNSSSNVSVLVGNGDGTFRSPVEYPTGYGPVAIRAGDFNADGKQDVAVVNSIDGTISILIGNGDGSLRLNNDFSCGTTPLGLVTGDFNGDGRIDLATANGTSTGFTVLTGSGTGQFNSQTVFSTDYTANGLTVGDSNGDGALDIIILDSTSSKAQVWLGH